MSIPELRVTSQARTSDAVTSAFDELPPPGPRRNTYDVVAEAIVELLRTRRLRPGDPLITERELMERFGVGRSSVREALRVLEAKGVIEGRRGDFVVSALHAPVASALELVMETTGTTLAHLHSLRHHLECESAIGAAERRSAADLVAIEQAEDVRARAFRAALAGDAPYRDAALGDVEFHAAIAEAAGNPLAVNVLTGIKMASLRVYPYELRAGDETSGDQIQRQHRALIDAIAAGNAKRAATAMGRHLDWVLDAYRGDVAERPLFS